MNPEGINFSPEEMTSFDRAAVRPYLKTTQFTDREGNNYGSKTQLRRNVRVSLDKNAQLHFLVMEWRNGTLGVKATLWSCHEGEGEFVDGNAYGLNEAFEIGIALFPAPGPTEDDVFDMWTYVNESESVFNSQVDFATKYSQLVTMFRSRVSSHPRPWPEPQNETAVRLVGNMLGEAGTIAVGRLK